MYDSSDPQIRATLRQAVSSRWASLRLTLWLVAAAALVTNAATPPTAHATTYPSTQPYLVTTLESDVAAAAAVVRGSVVDLSPVPGTPDPRWGIATVRVTETLKGERRDTVRCVVYGKYTNDQLPAWLKAGTDGLWCLRGRGDDYADWPAAADVPLVADPKFGGVHALNGGDGAFAFSLESDDYIRPGQVLEAARRAAKADRPGLRSIDVAGVRGDPPSDRWFDRLVLRCPVDQRLEARARLWARSRNPRRRLGGVQALAEFNSAENADILKQVFADVAAAPADLTGEQKQERESVIVLIHTTLGEWGVPPVGPSTKSATRGKPEKD